MIRLKDQQIFRILVWDLFGLAVGLPFVAWLQNNDWSLEGLTAYRLFPLLGMWAWFVMWTHFIIGAVRLRQPELRRDQLYSTFSRYFVLTCLILHPGILIFKQWQNGFGLPPGSTTTYVGKAMALAIYIALVAWVIFLSFEFFDRLKDKPIVKNNWRWISVSQAAAMVLIFVHALRLGGDLGEGWFRAVWIGAGILLLPAFYVILKHDFEPKT